MTLSTVAVLRPGDWVHYDGSEHQVLALAGTAVRLRSDNGSESVVLAGHLMASPGFAVVDSEPAPSVEPFALLDSLPGAVLDAAREWERHVVEIETGHLAVDPHQEIIHANHPSPRVRQSRAGRHRRSAAAPAGPAPAAPLG